ncbi:MAG: hypothetical protein LUC44_06115 [Prevotellaceae bacterium]|nr:hypothetical protein [Prevotellaceae bacterium]
MDNENYNNTPDGSAVMDCFGRVSPCRHVVPACVAAERLESLYIFEKPSRGLPEPSPYRTRVMRFLSDFAGNIVRAGGHAGGECSIEAAVDPDKAGRLLSGKRTPLDGDIALFRQTIHCMAGWRIHAEFDTSGACTRDYRMLIVRETAVKEELPQIELTCAFVRFRREILEWMEKRTEGKP